MRKSTKLFIAFTLVIVFVIAYEIICCITYDNNLYDCNIKNQVDVTSNKENPQFSIRGYYVNLLPFTESDTDSSQKTLSFDKQKADENSAFFYKEIYNKKIFVFC